MDLTRLGWVGLGLAVTMAAVSPVQASPYSAEYVFGDSLSDNGNLAELFYRQNFPNPPSYQDSFTNGPVANDVLAGALGLSLTPSLWVTGFKDTNNLFGGSSYVPGTNYAVAAATAAAQAVGGLPGINLPQQIMAYTARSQGAADPNALYVVEIGGNDVRNAAKQGTGAVAVTAGVQAELGAIQALVSLGARNLLVVNVPNVGVIPEFTQDNPIFAAAATTYSQSYNAQLSAGLSAVPAGTALTLFDLYSYNTGLIANAAALGFTDTTDRCYTTTPLSPVATPECGVNGANISQFYYWDAIHPSARVQALWATGFENALGLAPQVASVPEPGSLALLGFGLAGVIGLGRRRINAAR